VSGGVCEPIDGGTDAAGGIGGAGGRGGGGSPGGGAPGSGGSGGGSGGAPGSGGVGTTDGGNGSTNMPCTNGLGIQVNALVKEVDVPGSPPTPMGGTIPSGAYALTAYTVYGGSTGAQTFKAASYISDSEFPEPDGGIEQFLSVTTTESDDGSDGLIMSQGIFPSQGADGFGQVSAGCVGTSNIWNPHGFSYTATFTSATSGELTIYESGPSGSTLAFGFAYRGD
jgi:hypothetical protein